MNRRWRMANIGFCAFISASCAAPLKADALATPGGRPTLASSVAGYTVRLEDESGNTLPEYPAGGNTFVLGQPGRAYTVRVDNPTPQRIEVVVSVDGRDVVTGDPGDFSRQRGYVVPPYGQARINGFRRSMADVAQFRFTGVSDSYSARRGTPENVGVIGVAVFTESVPTPPPPVQYLPQTRGIEENAEGDSSAPAQKGEGAYDGAGRAAAAPPGNLGTQYGETRYAPVGEVAFTRARPDTPDAVLGVYYDDQDGLVRRGILTYRIPEGPQPFPEARRFAPPPP